jgi:hypothetical protein
MTGSFWVSVQARSVYGPGNWTEFQFVTVPGHFNVTVIAVVVSVVVLCMIGLAIFGAWQWKKNKEHQAFLQGGLVSMNGAYVPVVSFFTTITSFIRVESIRLYNHRLFESHQIGGLLFCRASCTKPTNGKWSEAVLLSAKSWVEALSAKFTAESTTTPRKDRSTAP